MFSRKKSESNSGTALAPGGLISRERIVPVFPEKIVQFDDIGNPTLISRKKLPSGPGIRQEMIAKGFILTPGGYRSKSLVHQVEQSQALFVEGTDMRIIEAATKNIVKKLPQIAARPDEVPALGSGWITYAYWNNGTGHSISTFKTTWQVPEEPELRNDQTIFLFNGIQNYGINFGILQPVLQWGPSAAGGGQYWSVASWYVTSGGLAFHTQPVRVNAGDTLAGTIRLTGQSGNLFNYSCQFEGINNTLLDVHNIAELLWCNEALEAYSIDNFAEYPAAYDTPLKAISVLTGNGTPRVNWTPVDAVTDCGQHCVIVNNSAVNGEVDICYRFKQIMNDTAVNAPGAVEFKDKVVVAWAGTDSEHHLNIIQSQTENIWIDKLTLTDTSPAGASLCVFNDKLYLTWSGTGNKSLNVMCSKDGINWENKVVLTETSGSRPSLTVFRNYLVLGWVGAEPQQRLNVLFSTDGINWTNKRILEDSTIDTPALAIFNNRLFIAWTGTNSGRNLNIMSSGDLGATWQNKVTLAENSVAGPGLFAFDNQLYLSWSGTDANHSINVMLSNDGMQFIDKVTLWDSSDFTPVLTPCYGNSLGVAWTGRDTFHHLNLMTI